eukprot:363194-Chlamydomonas_euryale.AAC.2
MERCGAVLAVSSGVGRCRQCQAVWGGVERAGLVWSAWEAQVLHGGTRSNVVSLKGVGVRGLGLDLLLNTQPLKPHPQTDEADRCRVPHLSRYVSQAVAAAAARAARDHLEQQRMHRVGPRLRARPCAHRCARCRRVAPAGWHARCRCVAPAGWHARCRETACCWDAIAGRHNELRGSCGVRILALRT